MDSSQYGILEIAGWQDESFDDGPMIRTVLFLQGCSRGCPGCHNAGARIHGRGTLRSVGDIVSEAIKRCRSRHITISGGEPLEQLPALRTLLSALRSEGFDICLYTGCETECVPEDIVSNLSYLKTGRFISSLHRAGLQYVGSSNQKFFRVVNGCLQPMDIGADDVSLEHRIGTSQNKKCLMSGGQKKDLANRASNSSGSIVGLGQKIKKEAILSSIPERFAAKHRSCTIHIHDLEFYDVVYNCLGVHVADLAGAAPHTFSQMLRGLFRGITELTNDQSGGIGFLQFDTESAAYLSEETQEELVVLFREFFLDLNTLVRKGCEKAYVTFNFGLGTGEASRRVSFAMLDAFDLGQENGAPFIFPNLVFKLRQDRNLSPSAPNHDLYERALAVTARRMIPTYFNCGSESNAQFDSDEIGIMGCRTRVASNVCGRAGGFGRGNVACVTVNLVQMAYAAKRSSEKFLSLIDENLIDARDLLLHRFEVLSHLESASDWMCIRHGFALEAGTVSIRDVLRNGTLSIGFIGLWDALRVLTGEQIDNEEALRAHFREAYGIVRHMREFTDRAAEDSGLNFSLLASAAEGVTGRFAMYDSEHLGKGNSISDKGFYSNSFHVPVDVPVSYMVKAELEGPFHALCNGGAITYIESREMPDRNVAAVQEVIEESCRCQCNYIGLNFPLDFCQDCGFSGRMTDACPHCGSRNIRRLRRVSGYLADVQSFAAGKTEEVQHRVASL